MTNLVRKDRLLNGPTELVVLLTLGVMYLGVLGAMILEYVRNHPAL